MGTHGYAHSNTAMTATFPHKRFYGMLNTANGGDGGGGGGGPAVAETSIRDLSELMLSIYLNFCSVGEKSLSNGSQMGHGAR